MNHRKLKFTNHQLPFTNHSFTLIELLIVIAVLGILAVAVVTALNVIGNLNKASLARAKTFSASLENALSINQVGKWSFEEGTGTTAKDTSGYENDGTVIDPGNMWQTESQCGLGFGKCLKFDTDDHVEIPNNPVIDFGGKDKITVAAWVKFNSLPTEPVSLIHKWAGYTIETTSSSPWKIRWTLQTTTYLTVIANKTISLNTWYLIVGTYNGVTSKLYLNGAFEKQDSLSGAISSNTNPLRFGCRSDVPPCTEFFTGIIDEVQIYSEALTFSQIQQLYAQGLPRHQLARQ